VTGKRQFILKAISVLVAEEFASENRAGGVISERPFREGTSA
jgi:hypothetical protein